MEASILSSFAFNTSWFAEDDLDEFFSASAEGLDVLSFWQPVKTNNRNIAPESRMRCFINAALVLVIS